MGPKQVEKPKPPVKENKQTESELLKNLDPFGRLMQLVEVLRGKNGCPWDRKQTPKSMTIHLLEEVYELIDSIESGSDHAVCEELGDVLFHIVFIASLYKDGGSFDLPAAATKITEKMIHRHPHIFGDRNIETVEDVKKQWKQIKDEENRQFPSSSILDSIPAKLPALMKAYKISERAAGSGFDWDTMNGVMKQAEEEWAEFNTALAQESHEDASLEFGDILFTLVNVARFAGIHPETALSDSVKKFEERFRFMEKELLDKGEKIETVSRQELDRLWVKAKQQTGPSEHLLSNKKP
ncbi:MAG: nucleoside triphosphate pyrophosphohydrolase [Desulfobacteraceae bacterium]|nr:MAG: nucleoside triphosphate pyrophosphohydrolase [Desulfobacteraceae bacterium]